MRKEGLGAAPAQEGRPQPEANVSHTPGPWLAGKPSSIVGWPVVAPHADGRLICNINFAAHSAVDPIHPEHRSLARAFNDESEANARLIAAAPELYEALKEACQEIADLRRFANNNGGMFDSETFSPGLAAIAKVEGRS